MNRAFEAARPYLANDGQLCRARLSRLEEGSARGQRIVDVDNGSGLAFTVTPDRGMNLVECSFQGIPIAFRTPGGHRGVSGDWLNDWPGGMVTLCGLRNVGTPCGGHGLHGSISAQSAEQLAIRSADGEITISGRLREGALFGANLQLDRTIHTEYGRNTIEIHDTIRNNAEHPEFTELLYHCNFGYPLVAPSLIFDAPEHPVAPRNEEAASGLEEWNRFPPPLDGFNEHCFLHDLPPDGENCAELRIRNPELGVAVRVRYDTSTLPRLVEWKKPSRNSYVLGLEPTNASLNGCEFDRVNGYGKELRPGESLSFRIQLIFEQL